MKKKLSIIICIISLLILIVILVIKNMNVNIKDYSNELYSLKYDSTWKILDKNNYDLELEHKRSKSSLKVKYKELDVSYIDTKLDVIISDIMHSIELQNDGFLVISEEKDDDGNYSYLYEKNNEQALVTIMKKDNKLLIIYYNATYENFDIVLDSVEEIIDSIVLK